MAGSILQVRIDEHVKDEASDILTKEHLPVGIASIESYSLLQGLQLWWDSRLISKNRKGYII